MKYISLAALSALTLMVGCTNYNDYKGVEEKKAAVSSGSIWKSCDYSFAFAQRTVPDVMIANEGGKTEKHTPFVQINDILCDSATDDPDTAVFTVKASISHGAKGKIPSQSVAVPFFIEANDKDGDVVYERKVFNLMFDLTKKFPQEQTFVIPYNVKSLKERNVRNFTFWSGLWYTKGDLWREYNDRQFEIEELISAKIDTDSRNVIAK